MQNSIQINKILEDGEKIYPINKYCDERLEELYEINNWYESFYNIKKGLLKNRFIELMKKSEYSEFFRGLNYEYGINNCQKDLNKAFLIYKNAADNSLDTMAMFRMYHIYKNDFNKFNISKRTRILEKFYLFKCFCFSKYPIMKRNQNMCNRFDIKYEVYIHFTEEDIDRIIFPKFIEHLKKHYNLYKINKNDVDFIEIIMNIIMMELDEVNINEELTKLYDLIDDDNLEALYKYICLNKELSDEYKEEEFQKLYNKKYYRSYIDYALFLNNKNRREEALKLLTEARNKGLVGAGFLYFDIYLDGKDFNEIITPATINFSPQCELYNFIQILIDDIVMESVFSFFECIFLLKICFKHYNLEYMINVYFYEYTKEIINFLLEITKEKDQIKGKELVKKYFNDDENYKEYHLACGVAHYYGLKNILQRDIDKAYYHLKIAYDCESSPSYKRFCYFYIYKISKIYYKEKTLNKNSKNKNQININELLVSETKLKIIKAKIFNDYYKSIEDDIKDLSSSFFYYISRLYNKQVGNTGNKMMEYICLKKAYEYNNKNPGSGSIISFYRKFKAKNILEKNKEECNYIFKHSLDKKDSEGYGENGEFCPICFDQKRNTMSLPCKHLFCEDCLNKMEKCPLCRKNIMIRFKIEETDK